jgi:hypothetical protein
MRALPQEAQAEAHLDTMRTSRIYVSFHSSYNLKDEKIFLSPHRRTGRHPKIKKLLPAHFSTWKSGKAFAQACWNTPTNAFLLSLIQTHSSLA